MTSTKFKLFDLVKVKNESGFLSNLIGLVIDYDNAGTNEEIWYKVKFKSDHDLNETYVGAVKESQLELDTPQGTRNEK